MGPRFKRRTERYTILPGRFQPPHNDHVDLVRRIAQLVPPPFYLGLIVHEPSLIAGPDVWPSFDNEARQQNRPERVPFTFNQRRTMWQSVFATDMADTRPPEIIALPRPESAWEWVTALFPGHRTWVVPDCGEEFDDMKAAFFEHKGDRVLRPLQRPTTDGRIVRAVLDDPAVLRQYVPAPVATWVDAFRNPKAKEITCQLES